MRRKHTAGLVHHANGVKAFLAAERLDPVLREASATGSPVEAACQLFRVRPEDPAYPFGALL